MRRSLVACIIFLCGCQSMQTTAVSMGMSQMPNPFDTTKAATVYETYYDIFPDVPLPRDMKVDHDKTWRSNHDPDGTGFIMLTGNVDLNSLATAQAMTLIKDGWSIIAFFRSPHSLIVAEKGQRVCAVVIAESLTVSYMMIWVTPRSAGFNAPLSRYTTPEELERAIGKAPPEQGAEAAGEGSGGATGAPMEDSPQVGESQLST